MVKTKAYKRNVTKKIWELSLSSQHQEHISRFQWQKEEYQHLVVEQEPLKSKQGLIQMVIGEYWSEVISTATKLDNIMVRPEMAKPPHTLFY